MAETAKDLVKKDLKEKKLKVPELDEKTKKHRDQMALLEIRSDLDPYLIDNPTARLGFDIIERGLEMDGKSGGELLAMIAGGKTGLYNYNFSNNMYGMMLPSSRLRKTPYNGPLLNTDDFPERYRLTTQVLKKQGIESLLPASEGSTIYYETGYVDDPKAKGYKENAPKDQGLSVLMEELSHLGMRYLQTEMGEGRIGLGDEEEMMQYQRGRSAAERGVFATDEAKRKYDFYQLPGVSTTKDRYDAIDKSAMKALKERGITATPIEQAGPTIMERLLGMFN